MQRRTSEIHLKYPNSNLSITCVTRHTLDSATMASEFVLAHTYSGTSTCTNSRSERRQYCLRLLSFLLLLVLAVILFYFYVSCWFSFAFRRSLSLSLTYCKSRAVFFFICVAFCVSSNILR